MMNFLAVAMESFNLKVIPLSRRFTLASTEMEIILVFVCLGIAKCLLLFANTESDRLVLICH